MVLNQMFKYQSQYLEIVDNFFKRAVGADISSFQDFSEVVEHNKANLDRANESIDSFTELEVSLRKLYALSGPDAFLFAKELEACKLVLGGSSRFYQTQLNAAKRSILFSDTVLIPDPILPYIERERKEERFVFINILKSAFFILQLKDLNQNNFDMLPFFIFPSWEKSLEENDTITQEQSIQLLTDVFQHYVDNGIREPEDIYDFSLKYKDKFYSKVERSKLFVAPNRKPGDPISKSLECYIKEMNHTRSKEWCNEYLSLKPQGIIINAVAERIMPQFHLLENADELKSNPLLCIDSQAHYYQLISTMKNSFISSHIKVDHQTNGIIKALTDTRMDFLANIPYEQMIQLRMANENVEFRKQLRDLVNSLPTTSIDDLGIIAGEVCAHIESSISKHKKEIESIRSKYQTKHKQTLAIGAASLGVAIYPMLAPFLTGIGFVATGGKYLNDKLEERNDLKQASHSLMGVISLAKSK
ncbi:hypothetical protein [Aliivibrio fischeri]|uniref:hypothetical protein n=1 Tax=Aliivibrio fischeri TaxID=668 RepID=UPI00080E741D|nr:hypothetical protein [Aliivibrio fischeri]OCH12419.1 hypothetical protein A6E09_18840 [Aliivibrio fischeri]